MVEKIAIVAMVSQSPKSLIRFCEYHLDIGVNHIFLYFDNPAENNVEKLKESSQITCISCTDTHWKNLTGFRPDNLDDRIISNRLQGIRLCRENNIEFVAPIDGDEFIYSEKPLYEALLESFGNLDALILLPYESVHDAQSINAGPFETVFFKTLPNRINKFLSPLYFRRIKNFSDYGFLGHTTGKTLVRSSADILSYKNTHVPTLSDPSKMAKSYKLLLLHFDCALEGEWIDKWKRRIKGVTLASMRPKRQIQYNEIKTSLKKGNYSIENLYREYYLFSDIKLTIGRALGLIKKITF